MPSPASFTEVLRPRLRIFRHRKRAREHIKMAEEAGASQKPEDQTVKAGGEHLNLKVKSQDGNEVYFKVRNILGCARLFPPQSHDLLLWDRNR